MAMDIGKHCHYCKQLDFLPFTCPKCNEIFCGDHRLDHSCKQLSKNDSRNGSKGIKVEVRVQESSNGSQSNYKIGTQVIEARKQREAAKALAEKQKQKAREKKENQQAKNKSTLDWLKQKLQVRDVSTNSNNSKEVLNKIQKGAIGDENINTKARIYYRFLRPAQEIEDPLTHSISKRPFKVIDMYFDDQCSAGRALDKASQHLGLRKACNMLYNNETVDLSTSLTEFPQCSTFVIAN